MSDNDLRSRFERAIESASDGIHNSQEWWSDWYGKPIIEGLLDSLVEIHKQTVEEEFKAIEILIESLCGQAVQVTCLHCDHRRTCEYAWDLYNTDGDCLATK